MPPSGKVAFAITADDRDLRLQMLTWRCNETGRRMHHRHAVFDGDRLPSGGLHVDIASRQAGEDQRLFAMNQMTAVELGVDANGEPQPAHCRLGHGPVRHGSDEIAAMSDEHLGAPIHHRLYGVDDIVTMRARRLEAKCFLELIQQYRLWFLVDAHRAVALHVGMTAYRADPGSGFAEIAAQQQQIHHLLHVIGAEPMLGDPHAIDDDNSARSYVDGRHTRQLFARQTADAQYVFPFCLPEIVGECFEPVRMLRDEIEIEDWFSPATKRLVMRLQHQLHDPLEGRDITADADLAKLAGDL